MTQWSTAAWGSQSRSMRSVSSTAAVSICWASSASAGGVGPDSGATAGGPSSASCEGTLAWPPGYIRRGGGGAENMQGA
eukprot:157025-Alexandrium_andersonii.AAC.1